MGTRKKWNEKEIICLILIWRDKIDSFRKTKRNLHIYNDISKELQHRGIKADAAEIRRKINNLTQKYRNEKKIVELSEGSPSSWVHFNSINNILDGFASNDLKNMHELSEPEIPISIFKIETEDHEFGGPLMEESPSPFQSSDVTSPIRTPVPTTFGNSSSSCSSRARKKRKLNDEILKEIKKTNMLFETDMKDTKKLLEESNKLQKQWLEMAKTFMEKNIELQEKNLNLQK